MFTSTVNVKSEYAINRRKCLAHNGPSSSDHIETIHVRNASEGMSLSIAMVSAPESRTVRMVLARSPLLVATVFLKATNGQIDGPAINETVLRLVTEDKRRLGRACATYAMFLSISNGEQNISPRAHRLLTSGSLVVRHLSIELVHVFFRGFLRLFILALSTMPYILSSTRQEQYRQWHLAKVAAVLVRCSICLSYLLPSDHHSSNSSVIIPLNSTNLAKQCSKR